MTHIRGFVVSTEATVEEHRDLEYSYSYEIDSYEHVLSEQPQLVTSELAVPVDIFKHASTVQALVRYLVDKKGLSFTEAANLLGRNPKSAWTSYHQTTALPEINEETLRIPIDIFASHLAPLEALVLHLKSLGLRNVETARLLELDPRTTHTVAKRGEVKR